MAQNKNTDFNPLDIQNHYFAAKSPEDTAATILQKADTWFREIVGNGYLDKVRAMWAAYYGAYYTSFSDSHSITFSGEQGELVNLAVNHLRNLAQHMLVMITSTRPSLQARAINTDSKSLIQATLANGLLDYYMREKGLEDYLKRAVEHAIVLGSGFIKMEWNATSGDVYDINEQLNTEIREGDVEFTNLSVFDVVFDSSRENNDHDWVLCRSFKNRYDFIAKYPEHKDQIMGLPSKNDLEVYAYMDRHYNTTDQIPVYEFYHKRSESMPDGRYLLFLSADIILLDTPLPYRKLPVFRISPSDILGTPYGYTPLFDILPIQDAINSLYSTILTNQNAFGVQNLLVPRGADVDISELSGGLNVVEANMQFGKIEPLQLTATAPEVFNFLNKLEQTAETISGVNSVSRGQPEPSLKSGSALALVQSMSLQFISGLQQSYVRLIEDTGTALINMLKDFASVPRIAAIGGITNATKMKEFTGDDLSSVNRIVVDIGNPLSRTIAGKVEMAEQLLQMGIIKTAEQYELVLNTGRLDTLTENTQNELLTIRKENESLVQQKPIMAVATDQHAMHIREHKSVLADPELRFDPELVQRVLNHIQEHLDLLRNTDKDLLALINEQPLGPVGGSPANQGQPQQPPQAAMDAGQVQQTMQTPASVGMPQGAPNMPSMPQPPGQFANAPMTPEDLMAQNQG